MLQRMVCMLWVCGRNFFAVCQIFVAAHKPPWPLLSNVDMHNMAYGAICLHPKAAMYTQ